MAQSIDFWFSIGSTYTYLSVMRIAAAAGAADVILRWRPFSVRDIMIEQKNPPFTGKPVKIAYMWRDIERRSAMYGLNPSLPAPYPLVDLNFANRIAIVGMSEWWGQDYVRVAYRLWFEQGKLPGDDANVDEALRMLHLDPIPIMAEARSEAVGAAYAAETEAAKALGVFGSPCFVVGREVFWGDDRFDDAVAWARNGTLRPAAFKDEGLHPDELNASNDD